MIEQPRAISEKKWNNHRDNKRNSERNFFHYKRLGTRVQSMHGVTELQQSK